MQDWFYIDPVVILYAFLEANQVGDCLILTACNRIVAEFVNCDAVGFALLDSDIIHTRDWPRKDFIDQRKIEPCLSMVSIGERSTLEVAERVAVQTLDCFNVEDVWLEVADLAADSVEPIRAALQRT